MQILCFIKQKKAAGTRLSIKSTRPFLLFLMSGFFLTPLYSQNIRNRIDGDQLQKFHLIGFALGNETRVLTENYQTAPTDSQTDLTLTGLNYCTLIGSRLGFYSDLYLQLPLKSEEGYLLDFTGGIGWNIWYKNWGLLPGIGFHAGCSSLKSDPFAEDEDMLYLSFGFGTGLKLLYRLTDNIVLYTGFSGNYDTLEFTTNTRYRDRDNKFKKAFDYKGSAGLGIEL